MSANPSLENYDDISSSDSEIDPPFLQPVNKEELLLARAQKRAEKKAEKHGKADIFKRMGDELYANGKFEEAYIPYLEATQIWPSNLEYYLRLAMTYAKLHWYEEAAHAATRALTLNPKSIEARYLRGLARLEQRLLIAAKKDLEIVVAHDKSHTKAEEALQSVNAALEAGNKLGGHTISLDVAPSAPAGPVASQSTNADVTTAGSSDPGSVSQIPELDFAYPQYDDDALEVDSLSNTSDCNHRGNGVPCRFYNREGCAKGTLCTFSHAPDEKSVRDELGRNVCTYYLLDNCKFGSAKCVYSHSRLYLPNKHGWWTSKEETEKVRKILEMSEKAAKERRSLVGQLQALTLGGKRRGGGAGKVPRSARMPKTPKVVGKEGEEGKKEEAAKTEGEVENGSPATGEPTAEPNEKKKAKKPMRPKRHPKKNVADKDKATGSAAENEASEVAVTDEADPKAVLVDGTTKFTTEYKLHEDDKRVEASSSDVVLTY